MAAQLTGMSGRPARGELSWMARAMSSLPVPLSPRRRTVASDGDACMTTSIVRRQASEVADDLAAPLLVELGTEGAVLDEERLLVERVLDDADDVRTLERLGDEVVGAFLHRLDGGLDGAVGGHQHHLALGGDGARGLEEVHPAHARHHEIGEEHRDTVAPE